MSPARCSLITDKPCCFDCYCSGNKRSETCRGVFNQIFPLAYIVLHHFEVPLHAGAFARLWTPHSRFAQLGIQTNVQQSIVIQTIDTINSLLPAWASTLEIIALARTTVLRTLSFHELRMIYRKRWHCKCDKLSISSWFITLYLVPCVCIYIVIHRQIDR